MNHLSKETSPYLLQHKDNPVNWFAWNDEARQKAKDENKLMLISIGYSTCHWCHVMEREVFEDEECAAYMNKHFVCIKVDREERPDVDSIYMDAVQLMGRQGGWPLNVFTLPDGRPIYGGTYFPKERWMGVLENLYELFRDDVAKMDEYATRLHDGLKGLEIVSAPSENSEFAIKYLNDIVERWSYEWDMTQGGLGRAPKFPMPNSLEFLLHYAVKTGDERTLNFIHLSLQKMAMGGIYDQIAGGFSRYSTDDLWKLPHFEKMLYDNAQLVSLYAQAYRQSKDVMYKELIEQTLAWAEREMKSEDGLFFSALDADSEGEEGKFYVWKESELKEALGEDYEFCKRYYSVGKEGFWEIGNNILLRKTRDEDFAKQENISIDELKKKVKRIQLVLLEERSKRIRPGLDNKCLTSWNALMVTAYMETFKALNEDVYLNKAIHLSKKIFGVFETADGSLMHVHTSGKTHVKAFSDSYALLAESCLSLYEVSGEEHWLKKSKSLTDKAIELFYDKNSGLFSYTSLGADELISGKKEVMDNVMPSSNSGFCKVLFRLAVHFESREYAEMSRRMLAHISSQSNYPSAYSNWLQCYLWNCSPFYEVVIAGDNAKKLQREFGQKLIPNSLLIASTSESELPLLKGRFGTKSAIYVCSNNTCQAPVHTMEEALALLK